MIYQDHTIHQRINAKGNAVTFQSVNKMLPMISRFRGKEMEKYLPAELVSPIVHREPKNAGKVKY